MYRLRLLDIPSSIDDSDLPELDPITNKVYSVTFDAALFVVEERCICGVSVPYPKLKFISLAGQLPVGEISVIGFMENINAKTVPLVDITDTELNDIQNNLRSSIFSISSGELLASAHLTAISCLTTPGFSGSPAKSLYPDGNLKAWGIFISGPALPDYKFFHQLINSYVKNKQDAKQILKNVNPGEYPFAATASSFCLLDFL